MNQNLVKEIYEEISLNKNNDNKYVKRELLNGRERNLNGYTQFNNLLNTTKLEYIKYVDLSANYVNYNTLSKLVPILQKMENLEYINLSNNNLDPQCFNELIKLDNVEFIDIRINPDLLNDVNIQKILCDRMGKNPPYFIWLLPSDLLGNEVKISDQVRSDLEYFYEEFIEDLPEEMQESLYT